MWMARVPLSLQIGTICFLLPVEVLVLNFVQHFFKEVNVFECAFDVVASSAVRESPHQNFDNFYTRIGFLEDIFPGYFGDLTFPKNGTLDVFLAYVRNPLPYISFDNGGLVFYWDFVN